MPNPAAAFSAFAMTKSIRWYSTIAWSPCLTRSRPGRPTMSPMNRIRIMDGYRSGRRSITDGRAIAGGGRTIEPAPEAMRLSLAVATDLDRDRRAAAILDFRDRDAQ